MSAAPALDAGFADPVGDAQTAFRALLDALARPGSLHAAGRGLHPPAPLAPATAAALLTLLDADTTLAVAPAFAPCLPWIAFHCGAPVVPEAREHIVPEAGEHIVPEAGEHIVPEAREHIVPEAREQRPAAQAEFVLVDALPDLATLRRGSDEAPQDGATVLLQVAALGTGTAYRLSGPGLREPATLRVAGLPEGFVAAWARNRAGFPRGVDLVLCAGEQLAALPRSVSVTLAADGDAAGTPDHAGSTAGPDATTATAGKER